MRQVSLIALVSLLALFTGGCLAGQQEEQAVNQSPSPQPAASVTPPKPSPAATPFGSKPLVAKQPGTSSAVPGLIQPELPENVIKRVPQGQISDPFAAVPVQPEVTVSPNSAAARGRDTRPIPVEPVPPLPKIPVSPQTRGGVQPSTRGGIQPSTRGGIQPPRYGIQSPGNPGVTAAKPVPNLTKLPSAPKGPGKPPSPTPAKPSTTATALPPGTAPRSVPELPTLPEPTQARGVEVTGVVEVGGVPMAIVKVPNEPARYVREGQRIANGQVLVKRIEMNRGPEPVVILEQYGIEVARGVGEGPATSPGGPGQPPPPPTASLPSAQPPLSTNVSPQAG